VSSGNKATWSCEEPQFKRRVRHVAYAARSCASRERRRPLTPADGIETGKRRLECAERHTRRRRAGLAAQAATRVQHACAVQLAARACRDRSGPPTTLAGARAEAAAGAPAQSGDETREQVEAHRSTWRARWSTLALHTARSGRSRRQPDRAMGFRNKQQSKARAAAAAVGACSAAGTGRVRSTRRGGVARARATADDRASTTGCAPLHSAADYQRTMANTRRSTRRGARRAPGKERSKWKRPSRAKPAGEALLSWRRTPSSGPRLSSGSVRQRCQRFAAQGERQQRRVLAPRAKAPRSAAMRQTFGAAIAARR